MKQFAFATLFLILCTVVSCSENKNSDETNLVEEDINYSVDTTTLKGYLVYDESIQGKRPGVLILHEWWGLNEYARKRARMLAELGYTAFALDMFGDGKTATHPQDAQKFASFIFNNLKVGEERFMSAYNLLKQQPTVNPDKIAAIGYCFGGGVALHMARIGTDLDAVISFHGSIATQNPAKKDDVKAYVLVCNGADDPFVTQQQIDDFIDEMNSADVEYEFHNYPEAVHSFTNPAADSVGKKFDMPLAYNEKADKESWEKMKWVFNYVFNDQSSEN